MKELPSKVRKMAANAEEAISTSYAQLTPLRGAIAALAALGLPFSLVSALDSLLATRGQNIAARRLKRTIDEIARQAQALDEVKLDRNYLESEEFYDLSWSVFQKGQRTSKQEKVQLYVRVLLRSAQGPPYLENAQEYVDLLSELSMVEVQVASAIYSFQRDFNYSPQEVFAAINTEGLRNDEVGPYINQILAEKRLSVTAEDLQPQLPNLQKNMIDSYLARLGRTGLVREIVHQELGENRGQWRLEGGFRITDYFRRMMAYLNLNDLSEIS
jgi:hypothetical protein